MNWVKDLKSWSQDQVQNFWRAIRWWLLAAVLLIAVWQFLGWGLALVLGAAAFSIWIGWLFRKPLSRREVNEHDHHEI